MTHRAGKARGSRSGKEFRLDKAIVRWSEGYTLAAGQRKVLSKTLFFASSCSCSYPHTTPRASFLSSSGLLQWEVLGLQKGLGNFLL